MSLFGSPEKHAANPPETWVVAKAGNRVWHLKTADGTVLDSFTTRKAAEAARETGFTADLYAKEKRWYAGENVPPWKPYAQVKEEQERNRQWQAARAANRTGEIK